MCTCSILIERGFGSSVSEDCAYKDHPYIHRVSVASAVHGVGVHNRSVTVHCTVGGREWAFTRGKKS